MSRCDTSACIRIDVTGPGVRIESTETGDAMHATREEWGAFLERVKAGEFDGVTERSTDVPT